MGQAVADQFRIDNLVNLSATVGMVRQILERYVAQLRNQPLDEELAFSPNLEEAVKVFQPPALTQLCRALGLSRFERYVLLLCAAMELDPIIGRLCAEAQGNEQWTFPTPHLASRILPEASWQAFTADAALRHWQLIEIEQGRAFTLSPMRIDESILLYLLGEAYVDPQLKGIIKPVAPQSDFPLPPSHQGIAQQVVQVWLQATAVSSYPVIQLCGTQISDQQSVAAAICALLGCHLKQVSLTTLTATPGLLSTAGSLTALMQRWERAARLTNSILLLDCQEMNGADGLQRQVFLQLLENLQTPLIVASRERLFSPQRSPITFDVPKPTLEEQQAIWLAQLGTAGESLNGQVEALAYQFNLSAPGIVAACTHALTVGEEGENNPSPVSEQLWDTCRAQARPHLDALAQRIECRGSFSDLVLPEQQLQLLRDIVAQAQLRPQVYRHWQFDRNRERGLGISALFYGASGTGKTTAAEIIAAQLRLDLYRVDLSAVVSKYIGETEKNLAQVFDAAEMGGVVLLFDEADALFGKRGEVKESRDRYANQEVSYLLQRIESYQGIAILTTNLKTAMDKAFERRLRFIIEFPFPDAQQRCQIWQRVFPQATPTKGLNYRKLAQVPLSGGSIQNVALNAAFAAAQNKTAVTMGHILDAARVECKKIGKVIVSADFQGWV